MDYPSLIIPRVFIFGKISSAEHTKTKPALNPDSFFYQLRVLLKPKLPDKCVPLVKDKRMKNTNPLVYLTIIF